MSPVDLHALPAGSVVAAPGTTLVAYLTDGFGHWHLAAARPGPYSVGDLLAMSQDWVVLRHGTSDQRQHLTPAWQDGYAEGFRDLDNLDAP